MDDLFLVMAPFFLDVDGSGVKNLVGGGDTASPNTDSETNRKK